MCVRSRGVAAETLEISHWGPEPLTPTVTTPQCDHTVWGMMGMLAMNSGSLLWLGEPYQERSKVSDKKGNALNFNSSTGRNSTSVQGQVDGATQKACAMLFCFGVYPFSFAQVARKSEILFSHHTAPKQLEAV